MTACPFVMCSASIELAVLQAQPGDDETTVTMIPAHQLEPDSYFGTCPASLMYYPLDPYSVEQLVHQMAILRRMKQQREQAHRGDESNVEPPRPLFKQHEEYRHGRVPQPDPDRARQWFSSSSQPAPRRPDPKPMGTLPGTGGVVASTAEVKAALGQAAALVSDAQQAAQAASGQMMEARQVLLWVKQTTVDDIGEGECGQAIALLDESVTAAAESVRKALAYKAFL
jgi:hypothetical protein